MADDPLLGTAEPEPADPSADAAAPAPSATEPAPKPSDDIDWSKPETIPPELQETHRRMMRSHTKRMEQLAAERAALANDPDRQLVERYRTDPTFRRQFVEQAAQEMGLVGTGPRATTQAGNLLVQAIEQQLAPELKWLAPSIAAAQSVLHQQTIAPLLQQQQAERQTRMNTEWGQVVNELSTKYPGWEAHEDTISDLVDFFKSDSLSHPTFGSKLELLYRLATADAGATANAARRMGEGVRQRVISGQSARQTVPNIEDRVRDAKSTKDAFRIAAQGAIEEAKRNGILTE